MPLPDAPWALVRSGRRWLLFERPREVLVAASPSDLNGLLRRLEAAVEARGLFAVGFVSHDAAAAYGLAVATREGGGGAPAAWFGLFPPPRELRSLADLGDPGDVRVGPRTAGVDVDEYRLGVGEVLDAIGRGDTYQANLTFPIEASCEGEPFALFRRLQLLQHAAHAAFVDTGGLAICSASPELFFALDGERVTMRPMKGTAARGPTAAADDLSAERMKSSEKERAENLMIVDMVRNDLGRVAEMGSVVTGPLFEVERYPTLLQLTSTVRARSRASLPELFAALFPCASVTGAPKVSTMQILARLEGTRRGVYTGAVGWVGPRRQASWSVAIRTAVVERARGRVVYGVGSGLVADSLADREWAECLLKARILEEEPFCLLETLLRDAAGAYPRLEAHLDRLTASGRHFSVPIDPVAIRSSLGDLGELAGRPLRVRLLVDLEGQVEVQAAPSIEDALPVRVGLAREPIDSQLVWLHHKTTRRTAYERARASHPDCDEVLLWNARGEVTETDRSNIAFRFGEAWVTPPLACGLLPGVARRALIAEGRLVERIVTVADASRADGVAVMNALRGWREALLVGAPAPSRGSSAAKGAPNRVS